QVLDDRRLGAGADAAAHFLAALEEHERRDREDAERGGRVLGLVDVALHDLDLALHLAGDLVDDRGEDLAGSAPGRMEIHEDGKRRLGHLRVPGLIRHRRHVAHPAISLVSFGVSLKAPPYLGRPSGSMTARYMKLGVWRSERVRACSGENPACSSRFMRFWCIVSISSRNASWPFLTARGSAPPAARIVSASASGAGTPAAEAIVAARFRTAASSRP